MTALSLSWFDEDDIFLCQAKLKILQKKKGGEGGEEMAKVKAEVGAHDHIDQIFHVIMSCHEVPTMLLCSLPESCFIRWGLSLIWWENIWRGNHWLLIQRINNTGNYNHNACNHKTRLNPDAKSNTNDQGGRYRAAVSSAPFQFFTGDQLEHFNTNSDHDMMMMGM